MKLSIRFLLIFSLLFLGRYEYLYAYTGSHGIAVTINPVHPDKENQEKLKAIELTEEDDDDKLSSYKNQLSGDKISSFHYAHFPEYSIINTKSAVPLGECALYIAPRRYILFGVFRV